MAKTWTHLSDWPFFSAGDSIRDCSFLDGQCRTCGPMPPINQPDGTHPYPWIDYVTLPNGTYWEPFVQRCFEQLGPNYARILDNSFCCQISPYDYGDSTDDVVYTINIPGFQDIIRIPTLENKQLISERIFRWLNTTSPIPKKLQWIPGLINWIDDCQDLIFTAIALGWPLLKRLPTRVMPVVGWVLIGLDLMNIANLLLGLPFGGRRAKRGTLKSLLWLFTRRKFALKRAEMFFKKFPWVPFIVQGAQVSRELTGYGLQLGGLMGLMGDAIYGALKAGQGENVVVIGPPPSDIFGKAQRVLAQALQIPFSKDLLNEVELSVVIAATSLAGNIVSQFADPVTIRDRAATGTELSVPTFKVWNPKSIEVLDEAGINREPRPYGGPMQLLPFDHPYPMIRDALEAAGNAVHDWENYAKDFYGQNIKGQTRGQMWNELTHGAHDFIEGVKDKVTRYLEPEEQATLHSIEDNIFPKEPRTTQEFRRMMGHARELAEADGRDTVLGKDLREAYAKGAGGWKTGIPTEMEEPFPGDDVPVAAPTKEENPLDPLSDYQ